jgi:hypothetical protein
MRKRNFTEWIIRILIYAIIGFVVAYIWGQIKK